MKYANDGVILSASYTYALCSMLGATHLVALYTTLAEQSSQACKQALGTVNLDEQKNCKLLIIAEKGHQITFKKLDLFV